MISVKLLKWYYKNLIKYFIGNTLRIFGIKLHQQNTIIRLLSENINNLSRSHSQSEICYQPQKHNKSQNT